jgi:uncharacterized protein (TIGR02271 family)
LANNRPVHVLSRDDGWAVVREGKERATSIHPTQAQAAKAGREIARKDGAEFLLHAKDGRIRERSCYGEDPSPPSKEQPEGPVAGVPGAATRATGGAVDLVSGIVGGAVDRLGQATQDAAQDSKAPGRGADETDEETGDLGYEERYAKYGVYDQLGKKLGGVDALFLDEDDELEYVGVKTDLLGARAALVPAEVLTVDDRRGRMVVARSSNVVEQGPTLAEEEMTPEFEERVRLHYGLKRPTGTTGGHGGTHGSYHGDPPERSGGVGTAGTEGPGTTTGSPGATGEDEIRVQRSEEELRVGTREREAGALRVRKRVRTDRERVEVPVRREEVRVERVPVSGGASGAEIGEDEIVVPLAEDEVVVSKRAVVKEEIRIRKDVVEGTEVVEEDVRREEVDVEDATERGD